MLRNLVDFRKYPPGRLAVGSTWSESGVPAVPSNGDGIHDPTSVVDAADMFTPDTQEAQIVDGALRVRDDPAGLHTVVIALHADCTDEWAVTPHETLRSGWLTMRLGDWHADENADGWSAKANLVVTDFAGNGYIIHAHREKQSGDVSTVRLGRDVAGVATTDVEVTLDSPVGGGVHDLFTLGWTEAGLISVYRNYTLIAAHQVADPFDSSLFIAAGSVMEIADGGVADVVPAVEWIAYTSHGCPFVSAGAV